MGTGGKFDLSPNHYSNMYEFVMKQPAIQQNKYLKSFDSGDIRVDRIFSKGRNQGKGTLIR